MKRDQKKKEEEEEEESYHISKILKVFNFII